MRAIYPAVVVTLVLLSSACGGGSSSTGTPIAVGSQASHSSAASATQAPGKTATPLEETASIAATASGETPTAPPLSAEGTPAVQPSDVSTFLAAFQGLQLDLQSCLYHPDTAIADCSGVLYAINPPIVAQAIDCTLWVESGTPRALACSSAEPMQTTYYAIQ